MSEAINKSDIIKGRPFEEISKEIDGAVASLQRFDSELKDVAKSASALSTKSKQTLQDIEAINRAERESKKIFDEKIANDKNLIKLEQERERLKQLEIKTTVQLRREEERLTKQTERQAKAVKDESDAYKKLSSETRKQKNEAKNLAAQMVNLSNEGKRNTKEYRALASQYRNLSKEALRGDKALKKIDGALGDNFRNVGNYKNALTKLSGALGSLGVVFGAGALLRGAGSTILTFEQSIADLQAITGAAGNDLKFFKEQAVELGKTTKGGASAVVEAYKLIGSAKPELLSNAKALDSVTQAAITLSKASGLDLPDAATRLTDAMNQFGAPAEKAGQFIDVLANGAKFGAAEIPQVTDALIKFGAAANTSNVSIEESTALIEALAEKGLKGAEAGTAIRNVMLKLSAPDALPEKAQMAMAKLGISFEDIKDKSKPFAERLESLKPLLNDNAALIQVFGTENAIAATNLLNNTDRVKELTESMGTLGTAQEQANLRSKTLGEAFENIGRAWDSFILSLVNGEDSTKGLREFLDWIARNLPDIIGWFVKLVKVFGTYKAVLLALKMKDRIADFVQFGNSIKDSATATDGATKSAKNFGSALKTIGLTGLIQLLIEVTTRFYDLASGASTARFQLQQLERATQIGDDAARKYLLTLKSTGEERDKDIKRTIKEINVKRQLAYEEAKALSARIKEYESNTLLMTTVNDYRLAVQKLKSDLINKRVVVEGYTSTINALKGELNQVDVATNEVIETNLSFDKSTKEVIKGLAKEQEYLDEVNIEWDDYLANLKEIQRQKEEIAQFMSGNIDVLGVDNPNNQMVDIIPEEIDFQTFEDIISEFNKFQLAITQILTDQIDKRIELMKKEESAASSQQSYLEQLAANGNITAQQSIAEQIEIQREAQREQARLERQKQTIELISAGLSTFSSELEAGKKPGEALASTILSTSSLVAFLRNIQFFAKGTDNAPEGLAVVDEQGAEIITDKQGKIKQIGSNDGARFTHLNKGDKVFTAKKTNEILTAASNAENMNLMNRVNNHGGNSYDIMILNKSLQSIENAVKNTPKNDMNWDGLGRVLPEFTRNVSQGGDRFTTRYKVKR